jgi:hypothetical protein
LDIQRVEQESSANLNAKVNVVAGGIAGAPSEF